MIKNYKLKRYKVIGENYKIIQKVNLLSHKLTQQSTIKSFWHVSDESVMIMKMVALVLNFYLIKMNLLKRLAWMVKLLNKKKMFMGGVKRPAFPF